MIGDIEPIPSLTDQPNWRNDYQQWLQAFRAHSGRPLAFTVLDSNWPRPSWAPSLQQMTSYMRSQKVKVAIIYNADAPPTMTNDEFLEAGSGSFRGS